MTHGLSIKPRGEAQLNVGEKTAYWTAPSTPPASRPELMLLIELDVELGNKFEAIKIEAKAIGGAVDSGTRTGFRGAFISPVKDTSVGDDSQISFRRFETRDFHVDERTNASVNIKKWEEGESPSIEFRPSGDSKLLSGKVRLDLLCVFQGENLDFGSENHTEVEVRMYEIKKHKKNDLSHLKLNFSVKNGETCDVSESDIITVYEDRAYETSGLGYSLHPKQLITAELLHSVLTSYDAVNTIGYIGLDTGENFHSVLRTIANHPNGNRITKIIVFYKEEWDGTYKDQLDHVIENTADMDIEWVDVDKQPPGKNPVDLMISTYVAVWALGPEAQSQARQEDYFLRVIEDLEEDGLILSVDPRGREKLARSSSSSGQIIIDAWYEKFGLKKINISGLLSNNNPTCSATLWGKKPFRVEDEIVEEENVVEHHQTPVDVTGDDNVTVEDEAWDEVEIDRDGQVVRNIYGDIQIEGRARSRPESAVVLTDSKGEFGGRVTDYTAQVFRQYLDALDSIGDLVECAGIPTKARNLSHPQLLNEHSLLRDKQGMPQSVASFDKPVAGQERAYQIGRTFIHNGHSIVLTLFDGVFSEDSGSHDYRRIVEGLNYKGTFQNARFGIDCESSGAHADEEITEWISKHGALNWFLDLCNDGYVDYAMSLGMACYWTTLVGKPGSGKSVRMRQVLHKAALDVRETGFLESTGDRWNWKDAKRPASIPILVKAKELAKLLPPTNDLWKSGLDEKVWRMSNEAIARAALLSTPLLSSHDVEEHHILRLIQHADERGHGLHLLIDALDEVGDEDARNQLVEWMNWTSSKTDIVRRILISTRESSLDLIKAHSAPDSSVFHVEYEPEILGGEFARKLIDEWSMNEDLVQIIEGYTKDPKFLDEISNPLLLGWLCRFVRDDRPLPTIPESFAHEFPKAILDHATFEHIVSRRGKSREEIDDDFKNSVSIIRNAIGYCDLVVCSPLEKPVGIVGADAEEQMTLSNRKNRDVLLRLRHNKKFIKSKEIRGLSDEEAHRLFFEDMSLLFISDSSGVEWTHQHLKEHAAAQFVSSPQSPDILDCLKEFGSLGKENTWTKECNLEFFKRSCSMIDGDLPYYDYLDDYFHIVCVRYLAENKNMDVFDFMLDNMLHSLSVNQKKLGFTFLSEQIRLLYIVFEQFADVEDNMGGDWNSSFLTQEMRIKLEDILRQWIEFMRGGIHPVWLATDYYLDGYQRIQRIGGPEWGSYDPDEREEDERANYIGYGTRPDFSVYWSGSMMQLMWWYIEKFHDTYEQKRKKIVMLFGLDTYRETENIDVFIWIQDWGFAQFISSFDNQFEAYSKANLTFVWTEDDESVLADGTIAEFITNYASAELFDSNKWKWNWLEVAQPIEVLTYIHNSLDSFNNTCESLALSLDLETFEDEGEGSSMQVAFAKLFGGYFEDIHFLEPPEGDTSGWIHSEIHTEPSHLGRAFGISDSVSINLIFDPPIRPQQSEEERVNDVMHDQARREHHARVIAPLMNELKKLNRGRPGARYFCPDCDYYFKKVKGLRKHRKKTGHACYTCGECSMNLGSDSIAAKHETDTGHTSLLKDDFVSIDECRMRNHPEVAQEIANVLTEFISVEIFDYGDNLRVVSAIHDSFRGGLVDTNLLHNLCNQFWEILTHALNIVGPFPDPVVYKNIISSMIHIANKGYPDGPTGDQLIGLLNELIQAESESFTLANLWYCKSMAEEAFTTDQLDVAYDSYMTARDLALNSTYPEPVKSNLEKEIVMALLKWVDSHLKWKSDFITDMAVEELLGRRFELCTNDDERVSVKLRSARWNNQHPTSEPKRELKDLEEALGYIQSLPSNKSRIHVECKILHQIIEWKQLHGGVSESSFNQEIWNLHNRRVSISSGASVSKKYMARVFDDWMNYAESRHDQGDMTNIFTQVNQARVSIESSDMMRIKARLDKFSEDLDWDSSETSNFYTIAEWFSDLDRPMTSPKIQRGYVWRRKQVLRFWQSLTEHVPAGAFLFQKNEDEFQIIDGKQRLFTILVGIAVIRDRLSSLEHPLGEQIQDRYFVKDGQRTMSISYANQNTLEYADALFEGPFPLHSYDIDEKDPIYRCYALIDEAVDAEIEARMNEHPIVVLTRLMMRVAEFPLNIQFVPGTEGDG